VSRNGWRLTSCASAALATAAPASSAAHQGALNGVSYLRTSPPIRKCALSVTSGPLTTNAPCTFIGLSPPSRPSPVDDAVHWPSAAGFQVFVPRREYPSRIGPAKPLRSTSTALVINSAAS